jgi:hypothetical protein
MAPGDIVASRPGGCLARLGLLGDLGSSGPGSTRGGPFRLGLGLGSTGTSIIGLLAVVGVLVIGIVIRGFFDVLHLDIVNFGVEGWIDLRIGYFASSSLVGTTIGLDTGSTSDWGFNGSLTAGGSRSGFSLPFTFASDGRSQLLNTRGGRSRPGRLASDGLAVVIFVFRRLVVGNTH